MGLHDVLPPALLDLRPGAQQAHVRRLGYEALHTPGARLLGVAMLLFSPFFARCFVRGIDSRGQYSEVSPFMYTMR